MRRADLKEKIVQYSLTGVAGSSLLALAGIVLFLFMEGLPLFAHYSVFDFLFGRLWYPTEDPGLFGIFPLLMASLAVTLFSSLLAVPLGVLTAVYLTEIAHPGVRRITSRLWNCWPPCPRWCWAFWAWWCWPPSSRTGSARPRA